VLEGHSLKHALVFNRRRAIFGIAIMISFFFNIVNIGADARMLRILTSYVSLQKDYKALKQSDTALKISVGKGCQVTVPTAASDAASGVQTSDDGYQVLHNSFTQLNTQH
jgi:hypothetical protein